MARNPGRVSALVLVCLLACLSHRDTVGSDHLREFEIRGTTEQAHRNAEERSTWPIADRNGTARTNSPDGLALRFREAARVRVPDEAWPVAFAGGQQLLSNAISRTMPRIIRRGRFPNLRGIAAALRSGAEGWKWSTRRNGFPFTGRFS